MSKKGQVTIFIIIAIVIVVAGILIFTFQNQIKTLFTSPEDSIYLFTENCVKDVSQDAIYITSQKGGYFISPDLSTSKGIAYYYINQENNMPSKKSIEEQISFYVENMLPLCTKDFINFPDFEITQKEINAKVDIRAEEIILNIKYPLTIRKENSVTRFEDFENIQISARLGIIYDTAQKIIKDQLNQEDLCINCISDIAFENELKIDLITENEDILFTIIDEESLIKDIPLKFTFANNY